MVAQFRAWDVWMANVEYEDCPGTSKQRPVVITSSGEVYVLALKVTSHAPRNEWGEYALIRWKEAGLRKPSTVRVGKRLRLRERDMVLCVGRLSTVDIMAIQKIQSTKKST